MALTLNQLVGFETQGAEELFSGSPTINTLIPRSGLACAQLDDFFDIRAFTLVADAGDNYVIGFGYQTSDATPSVNRAILRGEEGGSTLCFELRIDTDSSLKLMDAASLEIGSGGTISDDTWHFIEIYFDHSDTGVVEVFLDGISVISEASEDLSAGGTFDNLGFRSNTDEATFLDDVYLLSGATAASDRLGPVEVFGYQAGANTTRTGTPSNGTFTETGDTPGVEEADGTALEAAGASALTLVTDLDDIDNQRGLGGGPSMITGDTYYFDASDAGPTDNDAAWANENQGFDGNVTTSASTATAGTETTNEMRGEGTTAPGSGGTIGDVYGRIFGADGGATINWKIYTDSEGESLGAFTGTTLDSSRFGPWGKLTVPSGGWTFAKIQALEIILWVTGSGSITVRVAEIFVEHTTGSEVLNFDVSGTIIGAKWIYNLKRTNGSGTSMRYLYGNTGETATSSASIEATLTTAYQIIEQIDENNAATVPTSLEDFRLGISAGTDDTGGREIFLADAWCNLLHVPAAGGGDTTVTVPADALTETDNIPALKTGVTVEPPADSQAITDNDPALNTGVTVPVPADAQTITDNAPTVPQIVGVPQDSLSQTDQVPDIRTGVTVGVPADAQTQTDNVPGINTGVTVAIPQESLSQTDNAPTVPQIVGVPQDSLSQVDNVPDIRTGVTVVVPADALSETDNVPVIRTSIGVPLDNLTQTDQVPGINTGVTVAAPADALTETDNVPGVGTGVIVAAPQDALTETDNVPSLFTGATVETPQEALTQADNTPALNTGVTVDVPQDSLTQVDNAPAIGSGTQIDVPQDALTQTDSVVSLFTGVTVAIPANDNLTMVDFAPAITAAAGGGGGGTRRQRQIKSLSRARRRRR